MPKPTALPVTATRTAWMIWPSLMPARLDEARQRRLPATPASNVSSRGERLAHRGQQLGRFLRLDDAASRRPSRRRRAVVGDEELVVVEDVARHLDPVAGGFDDPRTDARARLGRRATRSSRALSRNGSTSSALLLDRQRLHVVLLERDQLLRDRSWPRHLLTRSSEKCAIMLVAARRISVVIVERPAEQQQVVDAARRAG